MAFLDSIVATNPADSEDIRLGASRIRALADATLNSFGAAHSLADGLHDYATDPPPGAGASGSGGGGVGHAARAYLGSGQVITDDTSTLLELDTENWDLDGEFDSASTYRFTPTVAGLYQVNAAVTFQANSTGSRQVSISKNTSSHSRGTQVAAAPSPKTTTVTASDIVDMNGTSDYLTIRVLQDSGGSLSATSGLFATHASFAKLSN